MTTASRGSACSAVISPLIAWTLLLTATAALLGGGTGVDATPAPPQSLQSPAAKPAFLLHLPETCPATEGAPQLQPQTAVPHLTFAVGAGQHDEDSQAGFSVSHRRRDKTEASPPPQAQWGRRDRVLGRGQPPTVYVTPEQCRWLTETVDDSMRWLLHQEMQQVGDDNAFPRIWCAHCSCQPIPAPMHHAAVCVHVPCKQCR